jgi:hypothetical protein
VTGQRRSCDVELAIRPGLNAYHKAVLDPMFHLPIRPHLIRSKIHYPLRCITHSQLRLLPIISINLCLRPFSHPTHQSTIHLLFRPHQMLETQSLQSLKGPQHRNSLHIKLHRHTKSSLSQLRVHIIKALLYSLCPKRLNAVSVTHRGMSVNSSSPSGHVLLVGSLGGNADPVSQAINHLSHPTT